MTCVCGIADGYRVWIGADSASSNQYTTRISSLSKVFFCGQLLIGATGSWRDIQKLMSGLMCDGEPGDMPVDMYVIKTVIPAIKACLEEDDTAKEKEKEEHITSLLIGCEGRLFHMQTDYGIIESETRYEAIGSGEEVASGSLFSTKQMHARDRIERALEAASFHTPYVRQPFRIESIERVLAFRGAYQDEHEDARQHTAQEERCN